MWENVGIICPKRKNFTFFCPIRKNFTFFCPIRKNFTFFCPIRKNFTFFCPIRKNFAIFKHFLMLWLYSAPSLPAAAAPLLQLFARAASDFGYTPRSFNNYSSKFASRSSPFPGSRFARTFSPTPRSARSAPPYPPEEHRHYICRVLGSFLEKNIFEKKLVRGTLIKSTFWVTVTLVTVGFKTSPTPRSTQFFEFYKIV
jgi:hypothetical protein